MTEKEEFVVFFGTQTGQSEALAFEIRDRAQTAGITIAEQSLELVGANETHSFWCGASRLRAVIVISSTGSGDPPDPAVRFVSHLKRRDHPPDKLSHLHFALLGLGDSNYSEFHGCPKLVERRLRELGAQPFFPAGFADDAVGLELVAEPWMEGLISAMNASFCAPSTESTVDMNLNSETQKELSALTEQFACLLPPSREEEEEEEEPLSPCVCVWPVGSLAAPSVELQSVLALRVPPLAQFYLSASVSHKTFEETGVWQNGCRLPGTVGALERVSVAELNLLTPKSEKKKFELVLDIKEASLPYEPGDALYFIFPNPADEVEYILKRLRLWSVADQECSLVSKTVERPVASHLPALSSLRHLFTWCLDIRRTPGRPMLRMLSEFTVESERRRLLELCSVQGLAEFTRLVRKAAVSLSDLLHAFPSALPPIERIIEQLQRLQPRPYSFACCREVSTDRARLAFSLVEIPKGDGRFYSRFGLCTGYLSSRIVGDQIGVLLKEPSRFRLPPSPATPLILLGPGTGVAPFLGFLQQLKHALKASNCPRWLFFGCRDLHTDYIYQEEMESYQASGMLSGLWLCESRPSAERQLPYPKYVQDSLRDHGEEVAHLLLNQPSLRVYLCGEVQGMSKDTVKAFQDVLVQHAGLSDVEAVDFLAKMKQEQRYNEDPWL